MVFFKTHKNFKEKKEMPKLNIFFLPNKTFAA
jgi:hypothetical protein